MAWELKMSFVCASSGFNVQMELDHLSCNRQLQLVTNCSHLSPTRLSPVIPVSYPIFKTPA